MSIPSLRVFLAITAAVMLGGISSGANATEVMSTKQAAATFSMTNDVEYRERFDLAWSRQPNPLQYPERFRSWLFEVSLAASNLRYDALAEAAMREAVLRWPFDGRAWGDLSCYLGNQARFQEALAAADRGLECRERNEQQLQGIRAEWLWMVGRQEEALAVLEASPRPVDDTSAEHMWLACRAYFHAAEDRDEQGAQQALTELLHLPHTSHWRRNISRTLAFDRYRSKPWFIDLVGETAQGVPPEEAYHSVPRDQSLDALAVNIPHDATAVDARVQLAKTMAAIRESRWIDAADLAGDGRQVYPMMPEFTFLAALTRAGLSDQVGTLDALRNLNHNGICLSDGWIDGEALSSTCVSAIKAVVAEAHEQRELGERVALALLVYAQLPLSKYWDKTVIQAMDHACEWAPDLAELYVIRARAEMDCRQSEAAERDLDQALRLKPDSTEAIMCRALLCAQRRRFAEAIAAVDKARTAHPDVLMLDITDATILAQAGKATDAAAIVDRLARANPQPRQVAALAWSVGGSCEASAHYDEGERLMRLAVSLVPMWTSCWVHVSDDLAHQGRFQPAIEAAVRAQSEGDVDASDAVLALACATYASGDRPLAHRIANEAREPSQGSERYRYAVQSARFAALSDDQDTLRANLNRAVELTPDDEVMTWVQHEPWFDAFRSRDWFASLVDTYAPKPTSE